MSLVYVGGAEFGRTSSLSFTSLTGGVASSPSEGDFVIIQISGASNVDRDLQVTAPSGVTERLDMRSVATNQAQLGVFTKFMTSTPDTSATISSGVGSTGSFVSFVHVWRGVDTTTPLDVSIVTANGADSRQADPPSITPTTPGSVIIIGAAAAFANGAADAFTTSGLSNWFDNADNGGSAYDTIGAIGSVAWTSGAYNHAAFGTTSTNSGESWAAYAMALRPAPDHQSGFFSFF